MGSLEDPAAPRGSQGVRRRISGANRAVCTALVTLALATSGGAALGQQIPNILKETVRTVTRPAAPSPPTSPACAIGERPAAPTAQTFANSWNSDQFTTFNHVLEGPPGKVNLVLHACTSASGGETVAVYPVDAQGVRRTPRIMFVIATLRGNARSASVTLPRPPKGQQTSRLPIMIVVENASGRPHTGEYRLTVTR